MKLIFFYLSFVLINAIPTCNDCTGRVCTDGFSFRLVDKITKQDLITSGTPVYRADSVYLTTHLPGYPGFMSHFDGTAFSSRLLIPVDTFFLRVSSTDIDTVLIRYNYKNDDCCAPNGFGTPSTIKFNGSVAQKVGNIYIFEK